MTGIDPKALEHACQCAGRSVHDFDRMALDLPLCASVVAHARAIEQHEAFKQKVSDSLEHYLDQWRHSTPSREVFACQFGDFIIPKPVDPFLIEAREVCARVEEERNNPDWATRYRSGQYDELGWVKHIRAALTARGLEVRKIGEGA